MLLFQWFLGGGVHLCVGVCLPENLSVPHILGVAAHF